MVFGARISPDIETALQAEWAHRDKLSILAPPHVNYEVTEMSLHEVDLSAIFCSVEGSTSA